MSENGNYKKIVYPEQKETLFVTKEAILNCGRTAIGKTVKELDKYKRLETDGIKGGLGHVIEESLYGYHINSDSEPDFPEAGVELKTTGVIRDKNNVYKAKERLALNIINYMKEVDATFETSSFWHKNKTLMLIIYEYLKNCPNTEFPIVAAELFSYPLEDLYIIRDDWAKIVGKIRAGKAHEISEGDTLYLGACTKGATAKKSLRQQPRSETKAKQRAYCLKQSYMTYVIQTHIFHGKTIEHIVQDIQSIREKTFEEYIIERLDAYKGKSVEELAKEFSVPFKTDKGKMPKGLESSLAFRILGVKGNKAEELEKAGVVVKTIHLDENGVNQESISFPAFKFRELVKEKRWEESELYNMLWGTRYLFVLFRGVERLSARLLGGQFWNCPNSDIDEAKVVWEQMKKILTSDSLEVNIRNNKVYNNLPKSSQNRVSHVRPHGSNREDRDLLPEGTHVHVISTDGSYDCPLNTFTKQCFWLNEEYVLAQIDERFK